MRKVLFLSLSLVLCLTLSGCYGVIADVSVNSNGSGTINARMGFSESAYNMIQFSEDGSSSEGPTEIEDMQPFIYNGKTYYGSIMSESFSSVEEFNTKTSENEDGHVETGIMNLAKNDDGSLTLTLKITQDSGKLTEESETTMNSLEMSEEELQLLLADMAVVYTFNMPGNVIQTAGDSSGIIINNNVIEIDFLKLVVPEDSETEKIYTFTTQISKSEENTSRFTDVPNDLWSCKAINVLAEGGLVSGVGDNRFSPERGMKISEFCQILANATGLESGADETGYWAAKSIKSCIEKGYIYECGEVNIENYSRTITREEAIAAMQLASGRSQMKDRQINIEDIPDWQQIDDKYKDLILQAYNSGITTGVNEQFKFSPKSQLTRGQVCQLFYNVNWTSAK